MFYQIHPIAHAGLKFDYFNDKLPANVLEGYTTEYTRRHINKRMQLVVNGVQMSDDAHISDGRTDSLQNRYIISKVMLHYYATVTYYDSHRNVRAYMGDKLQK